MLLGLIDKYLRQLEAASDNDASGLQPDQPLDATFLRLFVERTHKRNFSQTEDLDSLAVDVLDVPRQSQSRFLDTRRRNSPAQSPSSRDHLQGEPVFAVR